MRCRAPLTHRLETEPRSCSYPAPPGDASTPRKELAGQAGRDSYSRCLPAAAEHRAGPADPAGLWRHRDFFWSGHSVTEPGSAVTTLALAHRRRGPAGSALQVGLLTTATTVSFLLIAVPAGVVVDRIAKRKLMIACDAARMLVIGSVPSLGATPSFAQVAGPGIGGALFGWRDDR